MKNIKEIFIGLAVVCTVFIFGQATNAQTVRNSKGSPMVREFTGDIFSFNGPRIETANFTLKINKWTPDEQAKANLAVLKNDGQDKLLDTIRKENVGTLSINNGLSQTINVAREMQIDGKTRIFAVFERWMRFAEIRGGYRSVDYPFGVIELFIDPTTGKGEGTFIAAAQIRWTMDKKTEQHKVEIENFATYPAKMVNVKMNVKGM